MLKVKKTKIDINPKTKKRIEFYLDKTCKKYKLISGNLVKLSTTNLTYVEPHKAILDNFMILFFNYSDQVYVNNLMNEVNINELANYIKFKFK